VHTRAPGSDRPLLAANTTSARWPTRARCQVRLCGVYLCSVLAGRCGSECFALLFLTASRVSLAHKAAMRRHLLLATAVSSLRALLAFALHAQLADRRQLPIQVELHMSSNRTVTSFNRACLQSTAFLVAVDHLIAVSRQSCVCLDGCADAGSLCMRKVLPQSCVEVCAHGSSSAKASALMNSPRCPSGSREAFACDPVIHSTSSAGNPPTSCLILV
jgi:hypothetical protein